MNSVQYSEVSGVNTFFAYLYVLTHFAAIFVAYSAVQAVLSEVTDIGEAFAAIIILIIYIIFWGFLQLLSLVFLLLGKIWRQTMGILVLSLIGVLVNMSFILIPMISSISNIDVQVENIQSMGIVLLPFLLQIFVIVKGFVYSRNV